MTTIVDNRYRKAAKKLREIERLKNKNSLNEEERNKLDNEVNYKLEAKTFKKFSFTELPEEILNAIVEYLPINKRLAIFRYKYSDDYYRRKLRNLPHTKEIVQKLHYLASLAYDIIDHSLPDNSSIREQVFPYALTAYKKYVVKAYGEYEEYEEDMYPKGYTTKRFKEYFSDLIVASIKNYARSYKLFKKPRSKYVSCLCHCMIQGYIEDRMFYILKHLTVTEKYYLK